MLLQLNCGAGEDSWESLGQQKDQTRQSWRKSTLNMHWKDWCWRWSSNTLATWVKSRLIGKDLDAGKDRRQEEKGTTKVEIVEWHHGLQWTWVWASFGDGEGQGSLACCSPWGQKESDRTEGLNSYYVSINHTHLIYPSFLIFPFGNHKFVFCVS